MDAVELFDRVKIIDHCRAELFHFYFNLILTLDLLTNWVEKPVSSTEFILNPSTTLSTSP